MEYNTNRKDMRFREYGRSVEKIIENVCKLPEGEKKKEAAQSIITVMALVSGMSLRDDVSYHKLWDHLMIMSEFRLREAWPFDAEELTRLEEREKETDKSVKEKLPYKDSSIASRHYGEYIEAMLHNLKDVPDGDEYKERDEITGDDAYLRDPEQSVQMGDAQVCEPDEGNAGQGLAQQFGQRGQHQYVVNKPDGHDREQTDEEELALVQLVILEKEVTEHETETYVQSADIGHLADMAHPLVRAYYETFGLGDAHHNRHADEAQSKTDQSDQITVL